MHVDDELSLFEAAAQARIFFQQVLVLFSQRVSRGLAASLLGSQGIEFARLALAAPGRQMGRVQPLAAEQRADSAVIAASLGLGYYGAFVFGSELAALGLFRDLRIGDGGRRGGAGVGSSSAPVGLATLALPALRSCRLRLDRDQLLRIRLEHEREFLLRPRQ